VPAESMAGLLQGGVIEQSWVGGRMFGNAWLVNSKTGEGAWVGATHKVVFLHPLLPRCSFSLDACPVRCAACSHGARVSHSTVPAAAWLHGGCLSCQACSSHGTTVDKQCAQTCTTVNCSGPAATGPCAGAHAVEQDVQRPKP
jgi:hypothetical protein